MSENKVCAYCGECYNSIWSVQKYCDKSCKYNASAKRLKARGIYKGGYNRETHILLWLYARGEEANLSAPCHYCGTNLEPNNFTIDHKQSRTTLHSRQEMTNIDNLVIACNSCNSRKSNKSYKDFIVEIKGKSNDTSTTNTDS